MTPEKTRQVEALKAQHFGCEIEMNNITRKDAAKIVADYFRTHTVQHVGGIYDTYTAMDGNFREWNFVSDASICGPYECRCEMVTPILTWADIPDLQEIVRKLRRAGAVSNPTQGCGVHIHVDGAGHTPTSIRSLCNLMARYEKTLIQCVHIDQGRLDTYCQTVNKTFLRHLNDEKPNDMRRIEDLWYQFNGGCDRMSERLAHYNPSRYHMLNLHSFFHGHGTVEFRLFQFDNPHNAVKHGRVVRRKGGLDAGKLKAMIQLCLALNQYAKQLKHHWAGASTECCKKTDMDRFMYKLGMIGDEFKTARGYFKRGLEEGVAHTAPTPRVLPHEIIRHAITPTAVAA